MTLLRKLRTSGEASFYLRHKDFIFTPISRGEDAWQHVALVQVHKLALASSQQNNSLIISVLLIMSTSVDKVEEVWEGWV